MRVAAGTKTASIKIPQRQRVFHAPKARNLPIAGTDAGGWRERGLVGVFIKYLRSALTAGLPCNFARSRLGFPA